MPIINNAFNGKLNLDVANYRISNGDYIDALNITKDAEGQGQDRVVSNILGNENVAFTLPSGTNKAIGFYADKIRNRAYYFIWNSNGYNLILYYDLNANVIVRVLESKTNSEGIDILNFNPSYKVLSVNIFYRDDEGDLLFFNDGLNPPKYINVSANYGDFWKLEYILVAKAPPIMPPKVVYENDTTVTINNLRNKLFQFSYRFVYANNEKSVWSSKSIVPLPQQSNLVLTEEPYTDNSRISISLSTGGADVTDIEIAFRETTNGITSDWYLITSINKIDSLIIDNSIYTYKFKNDSIYTVIDVLESDQLQDYVPQKANAAELANGNVLLYSGITEGYNKTQMNLLASASTDTTGFYFDTCGLLFFAECSGLTSGVTGSVLKIRVFGTGTNTSNEVSTLNNPAGTYCINVVDNSTLTNVGIQYSYNSSTSLSVTTLLNSISSSLIASSSNWSQSGGISNNTLTMNYNGTFLLYSSGIILLKPVGVPDNTVFSNVYNSGYQYAIQYFDSLGRTIGAQSDIDASITTPIRLDQSLNFPFKVNLSIKNKPPLEAKYYQVLRSNSTTYNKILYWVSNAAYSSIYAAGSTESRYAYIDISNIKTYNDEISSTVSVVSYTFTQGDRIRFLQRYDVENNAVPFAVQYDYEIIGTETTIDYNKLWVVPMTPDNTVYTATGNFIKIKYPTSDIGDNFKFNGYEDFQHYEILLYNYSTNASSTQRFFYEFGKQFGIGNSGTTSAYHIGDFQTQSATSPETTPAIIQCSNGDLFSRKRNVPYGDSNSLLGSKIYGFISLALKNVTSTFEIYIGTSIDNTLYTLQTQPPYISSTLSGAGSPQFADTNYLLYNKSATSGMLIQLDSILSVRSTTTVTSTSQTDLDFGIFAIICTPSTKYSTSLLQKEQNVIKAETTVEFVINKKINLPANSKMWIVQSTTYAGPNLVVPEYIVTLSNTFDFNVNIIKNKIINIIESSFNDTYNLVTNSNGRPSVIDENAKQTYFPTLIRFGGAYQVNTNINQINNFKYENFDEYDRSFGDVIRLHVRDRYLKVYQKFKVGNVPILTQIVKDSANNPLQANTDQLINKIQYYAGDYGIGDAATSLAWNNFADYFVDNYRGVVCRLSQDGITPISITNLTNAFFVVKLAAYRQDLNNGLGSNGLPNTYTGNPCIYGVFDAYTNKYIISLEEINRYSDCAYNGGSATIYVEPTTTTTTTTTLSPVSTTTTTTTTTISPCSIWTGTAIRSGFFYTTLCAGPNKLVKYYYTAGQTVNLCSSFVTGVNQSDFEGSGFINTGTPCI